MDHVVKKVNVSNSQSMDFSVLMVLVVVLIRHFTHHINAVNYKIFK
jgi:hypothetical protein